MRPKNVPSSLEISRTVLDVRDQSTGEKSAPQAVTISPRVTKNRLLTIDAGSFGAEY
jgi:hypothetical protein